MKFTAIVSFVCVAAASVAIASPVAIPDVLQRDSIVELREPVAEPQLMSKPWKQRDPQNWSKPWKREESEARQLASKDWKRQLASKDWKRQLASKDWRREAEVDA